MEEEVTIQPRLKNINDLHVYNFHTQSNDQMGDMDDVADSNQEIDTDDNNLYLKNDGQIHLVDTIVQFKKSKLGQPYFRLTMYCPCCQNR